MIEQYRVQNLNKLRRLCLFAVTAIGFPVLGQEAVIPTPLSADQVMRRVIEMNKTRDQSLVSYSSLRSYHLECKCLSHKEADMVVRVQYRAPDKKEFTIVSESGSGSVRQRVFKKLLEAEQESMHEDNRQRTAINTDNYAFRIAEYEKTDADDVYVIEAQPRSRTKFSFRGRIWVTANDFAITRMEGEPTVSPSWWTERTEFKRRYGKVGDFWLPEANESVTKVRVFGTAILTIEYRDYQLERAELATFGSFAQSLDAAAEKSQLESQIANLHIRNRK